MLAFKTFFFGTLGLGAVVALRFGMIMLCAQLNPALGIGPGFN